jgi:hypothetical protein
MPAAAGQRGAIFILPDVDIAADFSTASSLITGPTSVRD